MIASSGYGTDLRCTNKKLPFDVFYEKERKNETWLILIVFVPAQDYFEEMLEIISKQNPAEDEK